MILSEPLVARMIVRLRQDIKHHEGFLHLGGSELRHHKEMQGMLVELLAYYAENFEGTLSENIAKRVAESGRQMIEELKKKGFFDFDK